MTKQRSTTTKPSPISQQAVKMDEDLKYASNPQYLAVEKSLSSKINALKNNHLKIVNVEERFYEELQQLEIKYAKLYEPIFEQRGKILIGEHEPTGEEAVWALDASENNDAKNDSGTGNEVKDLIKDMETKIDISGLQVEDFVGVPHFWLQVFRRTELISDMIQEHDEDVLTKLTNIKAIMSDTKPYGYTLEFHFRENEYFTNKVLTKTYELTCDMDPTDPFGYDGPVMYLCKGCTIDWREGKDVTMHTIKKRQKHKSTGTVRVVTKEEKQDSFFNFFDTPTTDGIRPSFRAALRPDLPDADEDDDEIGEDLCNADCEIGHFFKEFIIPKAVLYYTGELIDQAEDYNEDDELEDFFPENEDEVDEDDDEDDMEADENSAVSPGL